jgi:hypothetical protein
MAGTRAASRGSARPGSNAPLGAAMDAAVALHVTGEAARANRNRVPPTGDLKMPGPSGAGRGGFRHKLLLSAHSSC